MKKFIKIFLCVIIIIVIGAAVIVGPYAISFLPFKTDENFDMENGNALLSEKTEIKEAEKETLDLSDEKCGWFNYYGIEYSSDCYIKATINYSAGTKAKTEDFFLEPTKGKSVFYSFVDNALQGKRGNKVNSITFEALNEAKENFHIFGFSVFNREIPEQEVFIQNEAHKLGVDLLWGGALSYLEDLDSNVQAVSVDGKIKVDSNASKRYNAESVNDNVNLINRNDTGRLVQQSYYGTMDYENGVYMDTKWHYNPVQGGNQFNEASKIVDLKITKNSIYVKCRPLDWAKEKEYISPSYMEATYTIENGVVKTDCRFVDFSGYPENQREQEIPAFYCIEPFNNFVYYKGDKPWTDEKITSEPDLIFWPDANYPKFYSKENWAAFTGEFEDSFGIGIYVENQEEFLAGIFNREQTSNTDPSKDSPTSYIAVIKNMQFKSFRPFEYTYYLSTGDKNEIRKTFMSIAQ